MTTLGSVDPRRGIVAALVILGLVLSGLAEYTIRRGDTLTHIARRFGVSVAALVEANHLTNPDVIFAGKRLIIPGVATGGRGALRHVVRPGQTLSSIAEMYGVSVRAVAAANRLRDANHVTAGQRLIIPGAAPRPAASKAQIRALLERTAARYGWKAATIKAVAMVESGWRNAVVSDAGAIGVMQVLPETGRFVSRYLVGRRLDLRDPADNIEAGVAFLDYLYRYTGRDIRRTLGGYYQGLRSMARNGVYPSTVRYVDLVLKVRERFQ